MRKFGSTRVLCALALLASASVLRAQTTAPNPDPAITSLSVTGTVTDLKPDTRQVIVKTAAGNEVTVTLSDRTTFMRIPPGEKTKDKFIPIAPTDFGVGDSVFARGRMCPPCSLRLKGVIFNAETAEDTETTEQNTLLLRD
jgi:antitoxin (DNA-binding transcriptional repressor) of toxin-antitoxin stability system